MTQQSHCWAYRPRKPELKEIYVPHIILPLPSPTESKRLFYKSVSLLLSCIQGYHYHLSKLHIYAFSSVQFSSVSQSSPTLCDPMKLSTPGLPVHHQLPEFTQTHVY